MTPFTQLTTALALFLSTTAFAQSPATVTLDTQHPGQEISPDFSGLSFEMQRVIPDEKGQHYFTPDNKKLVALFKQLGVKNLRVGGNTADKPTVPIPTERDIDALFAFARAADVNVIFTLRARQVNADDAKRLAKYVMDHYGKQVVCIAVGNEPNVYAKTYPEFVDVFKQYTAGILAKDVAPDARFCGPSATPGKVAWANDFAKDFGKTGYVSLITQHAYPGGSARKVTDPARARADMLSPDWLKGYQKMHDAFVPAAHDAGLPYRLEECNSFFNGGAKDVSDTLASSLWALDYLHWWASKNAQGLNFHTGDFVAAGEDLTPCRYAAFWTVPDGYDVHPLGYALKAFDLGGHGKLVSAEVKSADTVNLTAYATTGDDNATYVTLINKTYDPDAKSTPVVLSGLNGATRARSITLKAPTNNLATTSGITLGGAEITRDAQWSGTWSYLAAPEADQLKLELAPATAVVVNLSH
jgi:hypothetical protein